MAPAADPGGRRGGRRPPIRAAAPGDDAGGSPGDLRGAAGSGGLGHRRRLRGTRPAAPPARPIAVDTLAPFAQAILVIRWGTTVVSLAIASPDIREATCGCSCAVPPSSPTPCTARSAAPLRRRPPEPPPVLGEVALTCWPSPPPGSGTRRSCSPSHRSHRRRLRPRVRLRPARRSRRRRHRHPVGDGVGYDEDDIRTTVQWSVECCSSRSSPATPVASRERPTRPDPRPRPPDPALRCQRAAVPAAPGDPVPAGLARPERGARHHGGPLRVLFDFSSVALLAPRRHRPHWHTLRREGVDHRAPVTRTTSQPLARAIRLRSLVERADLLAAGGPGLSRAPGPASTPCSRPRVGDRPPVDRARGAPPLLAAATSRC